MPTWKRMLLAALAEALAPKKPKTPTLAEYQAALAATLKQRFEGQVWPDPKPKEYLQ